MKKLFKALIYIFIIVLVFTFSSCKKKEVEENIDILCFHTESQKNYLDGDYKNYSLYANGTSDLSKPQGITYSFDGDNSENYTIKLSEKSDLSEYKEYNTNTNSILLNNLKINTIYYVQAISNTYTSVIYKFKTCNHLRNLDIDGITNIRDIGGKNGVKQGLIYRSSKLNDDESTDIIITEKGIETLTKEFKIKTEIDLRTVDDNENGGITVSPLGEDVTYISLPFKSGGNIILLNKDKIKDLFKILADSNNYPIVYHCSIGTDRTGMIAFLINGMMGVSEEDLYKDFLFSNFGEIGSVRTPSIIKTYIQTVDTASGKDLSEKIYNYLVSIGVSSNDLDNLKKNLK